MKYVVSVSKTYKNRSSGVIHRENTKKHWHIFYYEYDEIDEVWKTHFDQVNWITAMYYKMHKVKKVYLWCADCQDHNLNFIKKRNDKNIINSECLVCGQKVKDTLQEIADEIGDIGIID